MNIDEILTLVQAVSDSKLTSFKLDQGDMHISLKKEKEEAKIITVQHQEKPMELAYGFNNTSEALDIARERFERVKELTIKLSMVENSAYRLANSIKKTQKRANALKNITIPHYEELSRSISNALEEKEREEFTRLKVIKRMKTG